MSASREIILELKDVTKHYGKSRGVEKVNIAVEKGEHGRGVAHGSGSDRQQRSAR